MKDHFVSKTGSPRRVPQSGAPAFHSEVVETRLDDVTDDARAGLRQPRLGERHVVFILDGSRHDMVVPSDMSILRIVRDLVGHPTPPWRCEMSLCGSCEAVMNGEITRLCSLGPKRLDGAVIDTLPADAALDRERDRRWGAPR